MSPSLPTGATRRERQASFQPARATLTRLRTSGILSWVALSILASPPAAAQGVCGRTPQVRDRLTEAADVEHCAQVGSGHLARVRRLDLSGASLFALRKDDLRGLSGLETLDLSRNHLWTMPEEVFRGLRALRVLRLEHNWINQLPEEVFHGLHALKVLRLEHNRMRNFLTELPSAIVDDVLDTLEDLRVDPYLKATIDFTATAQQAVPGDRVEMWVHLNRGPPSAVINSGLPVALRIPFYVEGTAGAEDFDIPPSPTSGELLFKARQTQRLIAFRLSEAVKPGTTIVVRLGEPSVAGLRRSDGTGPDAPFLKAKSLLERDAERAVHRVTVVDPVSADVCSRTPQVRDALVEAIGFINRIDNCSEVTTADLTQVTELDLRLTGIGGLQAHEFRGLTSLELLRLGYNELSALPEEIFRGLANLEALLLYDNTVTRLPPRVFEGLESLRWLVLDGNRLQSLPEGVFDGLSSLEWLGIRRNSLASVTKGLFDGLDNLSVLALTDNQLSNLPEGIFGSLDNLSVLTLSGNQLSELPTTLFRDLRVLRQLGLDYNSLNSLPEGILRGLDRLEALFLHENLLATLPKGVFAGLNSLRKLSLEANSLTALPQGVFGGLESLELLRLQNNRLASLPEGVFGDLRLLGRLQIENNRLDSLTSGVFHGLDNLAFLRLQGNPLRGLPAGLFDDMLDTLGGELYADYLGAFQGRLEIDSRLKAGLGFASAAQRVPDGSAVQVPAQLSRALPVAVRAPYTLGMGGGGGGLTGLSPAPGGLLFRAGETRREVSFRLLEDAEAPGDRNVVLSLGGPSEIGLYRSDGSGPPAPYLKPESLLSFGEEATHTVTVIGADPEDREPFCLSLWEGAPCSVGAVFPHVLLGPLGESLASAEILLTNRDPGPAACEVALLFHRGTSEAPPVSFDGLFTDGNLLGATLPRGGASVLTLAAPDGRARLGGALSLFTRSPCRGDSLHVGGRTLLRGEPDGEIEEMFSLHAQSAEDWLGDGDCRMLTGFFGNGREERVVVVTADPGGAAPPGTRLEARAFDLEGNFMGSLASLEVSGGHQVLPRWNLTRPTIIELCLDAPGESGFRLAATAIGSKASGSGVQYYSEGLSARP